MSVDDRLDGWKQIADHLGKSVRTAHRWHRDLGLPVKRVQGRKGITVYASRREIDSWLAEQSEPDRRTRRRFLPWRTGAVEALQRVAPWAVAGIMALALTAGVVGAPMPGKIAYVRVSASGNSDIFLIDDAGGPETRLTSHPAADYSPSISPDGTTIAFSSDRHDPGHAGIYLMNIDGSDLRPVVTQLPTDFHGAEGVHWHPSGEKLVCAMRIEGVFHLFEVRLDGSDPIQLTHGELDHRYPRYSYDGLTLYSTRNVPFDGHSSQLMLFSQVHGPKLLTLTTDNSMADEVILNGVPVVVYAKRVAPQDSRLFRIRPDGTEDIAIPLQPGTNDGSPVGARGPGAARHDGYAIIGSARSGKSELWRIHLEGSEAVQLTTTGGGMPDWWVPQPSFLGRLLDFIPRP